MSTTAAGYQTQRLNDQALLFADRAIALAKATLDTRFPIVASKARIRVLIQTGKVEMAEAELKTIMARKDIQSNYDQAAELMVLSSEIARAKKDSAKAIADLEEARKRYSSGSHVFFVTDVDNALSDLYRTTGNLPKAEDAAREAANSAQASGTIYLIPQLLHVLAQVQISEGRYAEADRTYDRAAAIQDMMIGNANSVLGKTALIKGASDLYATHFALVAQHTQGAPKAFAVLEQARGRPYRSRLSHDSRIREYQFAGRAASPRL